MKKEKEIQEQIDELNKELNNMLEELNSLDVEDGEEAHQLNALMLQNVSKTKALGWVLSNG